MSLSSKGVRCVVVLTEESYRALQHGSFLKGMIRNPDYEPWSESAAAEIRQRLFSVRELPARTTEVVDEAEYLAQKQKEMAADD